MPLLVAAVAAQHVGESHMLRRCMWLSREEPCVLQQWDVTAVDIVHLRDYVISLAHTNCAGPC